jgi:hypothetical protein
MRNRLTTVLAVLLLGWGINLSVSTGHAVSGLLEAILSSADMTSAKTPWMGERGS